MTERCAEREAIELLDETVVIHCSLPLGHKEAHRAVIFWPGGRGSRELVSIDEIWEATEF
jgi:hypothetical protein